MTRENYADKEPCDDCVSRQAVEDALYDYSMNCDVNYNNMITEYIDTIPSVTPKPKTGHWIRWYEQKEHDRCIEHIPHCKCSECGKEYDPHSSLFIKYCNECGAKMVEPQESEVDT